MFRSPISPASVCTSARNSSRKATSSVERVAEATTFFPGILTPNHHSNATTTATVLVIRTILSRMRRRMSAEFFAEAEGAEREQCGAHRGKDDKRRPEFGEARTAQDNRAH